MGNGEERRPAALHVIVLGPGGGPQESNTTAFLVRSVGQNWRKGSIIAVDAGVHLSAITRLLRESMPSSVSVEPPHILTHGPFAGLSLPHRSADANAGYLTSSLIEACLVTHPHLDHISGFVVNTAGPPGARPKKVAGLPGTIQALKTHIFNNVIWPNLSDEGNGAGLLTYMRLVDGGSPTLGSGQGKGYAEVCDGLLVKVWAVSHGHCIEKHSHRGSTSSASGLHDPVLHRSSSSRRDQGSISASQTPRRHSLLGQATLGNATSPASPPRTSATAAAATAAANSSPVDAGSGSGASLGGEREEMCVVDSSAYFIQEQESHREVLIFGDVEPDSLSLSPRNFPVWQEAASRIAAGSLAAIFIECSYDDSRSNDRLFGHLKPIFVIEELNVLAAEVAEVRHKSSRSTVEAAAESPWGRKRKRVVSDADVAGRARDSLAVAAADEPTSPRTSRQQRPNADVAPGDSDGDVALPQPFLVPPPSPPMTTRGQLAGLKVVLIHIKEVLSDDQPDIGAVILSEVQGHEKEAQLGCEFIVARAGQSFYL